MVFKTINTADQNLRFIQDNVQSALTPLQNGPMVGGVLLNNITLTTGQDNLVQHTLGRFPQIFFIGNLNADSVVWTKPSTSISNGSNADSININLVCSANCIISLWIN